MDIRHDSLVTPNWLWSAMKKVEPSPVVVLDTSWGLPTPKNVGTASDTKARSQPIIPGAKRFDIDAVSDKSTPLPHMLPSIAQFEKQVSDLGIQNHSHIVLYDNNPNYFASCRVWWMFHVMAGHEKISILEGGLQAWCRAGLPTEMNEEKNNEDEPPQGADKNLVAPYICTHFRRPLLKTLLEIVQNIDKPTFQLVDARPYARFLGQVPELRPNLASGHIPGSYSLEFPQVLTKNEETDNFTFLDNTQLQERFIKAGIDLNQPIATTCGSGVSACVLAFALNLLGRANVAVYDGSWSEYGTGTKLRVDKDDPLRQIS